MFIIIMWAAFFARVRPVTRNANPTCMNSTRKPVMSTHVKLIDTPRCALRDANSLMPGWETGTVSVLKPLKAGPVVSPGL